MAKLNQIIAIEKDVTSRSMSTLTELYHLMQKPDLFVGLAREYKPLVDGDETLPKETKLVQQTADGILRTLVRAGTEYMDIKARKEWANASGTAKASIKIDDKVILADVPVTYMLFLERLLTDIRTELNKMPVLDQSELWKLDTSTGLFKTEPTVQFRTKKVQEALTLVAPTEHHPGQAQLITNDKNVGTWTTTKSSGSMMSEEKRSMLDRVDSLLKAVKQAREEANSVSEVATPKVADPIFEYLFPNLR